MLKMEENKVDLQFIEPIESTSDGEEIKESFKNRKSTTGVEMLLEEMLRFLGEMPVYKYHDYRDFRHKGLRGYLINRFLRARRSAA